MPLPTFEETALDRWGIRTLERLEKDRARNRRRREWALGVLLLAFLLLALSLYWLIPAQTGLSVASAREGLTNFFAGLLQAGAAGWLLVIAYRQSADAQEEELTLNAARAECCAWALISFRGRPDKVVILVYGPRLCKWDVAAPDYHLPLKLLEFLRGRVIVARPIVAENVGWDGFRGAMEAVMAPLGQLTGGPFPDFPTPWFYDEVGKHLNLP